MAVSTRMTYTRLDFASIWWTGLSDQEQRVLVRQFRDRHGGDAVPEPSALELFDAFNSGRITLGVKTPSLDS